MKKIFTKEVMIGLSVVVSIAMLVVIINFLKGINLMKPANYYYIEYKNVTGLTVSTPVVIDGFKVGLVRSIEYNYENPGSVIVEISLDNKLKVPTGSRAVLKVDFLGTATIDLLLNKYVSSNHKAGDRLIGENAPDMLGNIQNEVLPALTQMLPKIDSILTNLQTLVSDPALQSSIRHFNNITANLEVSSRKINYVLDNDVPSLMNDVKGVAHNLNDFSVQLGELKLADTKASVDSTIQNLNTITQKLNRTDNTMGLLLNDKSLYKGLVTTVNSADSLLNDLRLHPKRYVHFSLFGRKN
ncbi:MlaD family protein [Coprobacter tertius]|uniref:MlaD family protein n=1 Tax=Coprobacter tertius TaxID=2944915 RepID=A0ABT1MK34_9BACT|nr:MlaD family protein [Coprobacter tertius]MCP9612221.1 MlaD family protein [Coprobacter tertius]